MPQSPERGEINAENVSKHSEDHEVVGYGTRRSIRMPLHRTIQELSRSRLDVDQALSARHPMLWPIGRHPLLQEIRVALADLTERQSIHLTNVHFDERRIGLNIDVPISNDLARSLARPLERAGIDRAERLVGQRFR